eukprot:CAMPEP_0177754676 /NCGR_PEP_ID=MMETSP0491_2-20121128/2136_1 /TAXON_ID=63592 /ORGANISM="Tetraselmis chuii, Strain PLY429" /LENGTH=134 /DNA_ID=CAMNT_0019270075 /DNA_START=305 /DNA_END=706 /DNA_ORIENTATION=+
MTTTTPLYEPEILYEDKFVRVTETDVAIKKYYFPLALRKVIPGMDIESVQNAQTLGVLKMGQCKRWGMALNNIWWALDWGRDDFGCGKSKHVSVVVTSSRKACFRCGFSVEDEDKAREAFQKMLRAVSPQAEVW